jgi:hypothetical protein
MGFLSLFVTVPVPAGRFSSCLGLFFGVLVEQQTSKFQFTLSCSDPIIQVHFSFCKMLHNNGEIVKLVLKRLTIAAISPLASNIRFQGGKFRVWMRGRKVSLQTMPLVMLFNDVFL